MKLQFRERLDDLIDSDTDLENKLMGHLYNYLVDKFSMDPAMSALDDFVFDIKLEIEAWDHDSSPYNKNAV